jgi:Flp pilus assembly protein TadD
VLTDSETEVHYAVGSGSHGRSYLINRDGYLFQSAITWYPQKGVWDLAPGYAGRNHHFGRPITADCLFCHCNYADEVEHTLNRYRAPIFRGHAIGCERCHGPGALHVRRREGDEEVTGIDDTIVNPRHLEPALREAVCEQCHLLGQERIVRRGRKTFDYRPALPLHLFLSVFTRPPALTENNKFVGHVEQMRASRCFQGSAGKMGCTTCHDPHALPAPEQKITFYRDSCLQCHAEKGCSLPAPARREQSNEDSCIACHMPVGSADIQHITIADHRIPRRVEKATAAEPKQPVRLGPGEMPLVYFHRHLQDPRDPEVTRDLGIALMDTTELQPEPIRRAFAALGLPLLETALATDPDDIRAWDAKGKALWFQGRQQEALVAFETALTKQPDREVTLDNAANLAMVLGRPELAIGYWERAVKLDPWRWQHHYGLAAAHVRRGGWHSAAFACRQALKLNPAALEVRKLLIRCHLENGEKDQARAEFERLLGLNPPEAAELRRTFGERLK